MEVVNIDIDRHPGRGNGAVHRNGIGDAGHRISLESRQRLEDAAHELGLGRMPRLDLTEEEMKRIDKQVAEDLQKNPAS